MSKFFNLFALSRGIAGWSQGKSGAYKPEQKDFDWLSSAGRAEHNRRVRAKIAAHHKWLKAANSPLSNITQLEQDLLDAGKAGEQAVENKVNKFTGLFKWRQKSTRPSADSTDTNPTDSNLG